ncbi:hypothetical protein U1Q18_023200 [Sarracenia purpurea var. burkii]
MNGDRNMSGHSHRKRPPTDLVQVNLNKDLRRDAKQGRREGLGYHRWVWRVGVVDESGGGVVDARRRHGWSLVMVGERAVGGAVDSQEPSKMAEDGNVGRRSKGLVVMEDGGTTARAPSLGPLSSPWIKFFSPQPSSVSKR